MLESSWAILPACMYITKYMQCLEDMHMAHMVRLFVLCTVASFSTAPSDLQDDDSIHNAVLRYEIRHPCVNDGRMVLWRDLGISSWPTLAVVSPRGRLIATLPGRPSSEKLLIESGSLSVQARRHLALEELQCWVAAAAMEMTFLFAQVSVLWPLNLVHNQ